MKGQISILEAIFSAIILFIAFNMMITVEEYQTKWKESLNLLQGRDALITADRLGRLHDFVFSDSFAREFLNKLDALKDVVIKNETRGTLKNRLYVACNCTDDKRDYLQNILNDVKFNTRKISAVVCSTNLLTINNCGSNAKYPDVLVIWRYDPLEGAVRNALIDFVKDGNGLIEIADVPNSRVDGQGDDDHEGQKIIFGIKSIQGNYPNNPIEFLKPRNSSVLPYQSYKWFYHVPYLLKGTSSETIPVEDGIASCSTEGMKGKGNFRFRNTDYTFWICGTTSVYWDTNGNNKADKVVTPRNKFSIGNSNFFLNYIDSPREIRISFKPDYLFNNFIGGNNVNKLAPIDNDKNKVLLSMGFWDQQREKPIAAIIFNGTGNGITAWVADFARDGLTNTGDDHKQLLASLILSMANKRTKETFQQIGQTTSYINVNNTDILEIYKIYLSIGKPF
ncbi:MAG: hypothetical protein QW818_00220 [Candidatus Aenigmatarchaeota archaeon]